ncbi:MAG: GNAT family N-acetyltransferase [Planctomycetota bacterium]
MEYLTIENFEKGVVFDLLFRAFEPLMNPEFKNKLRRYDQEIFDNLKTVGASLFLTQYDGKLVGMASWDPRQFPRAIIGYNCIVPGFQHIGFGKLQLLELLNRLTRGGFTEAVVTTGEHPFFVPSQKMYSSCGFQKVRHYNEGRDPRYGSTDYHLVL